jgi:hypothetical protein
MRNTRIPPVLYLLLVWSITAMGTDLRAADIASWGSGLTDEQLAIQRWFSEITFRQDRNQTPWPTFVDDGKQFDLKSLRYQLAFGGYGCAVMSTQTPAYRQVVAQQLDDICQRIIDHRVWLFVDHYWDYGDDAVDPCRFDNVMYTGHLTQLMCLYEHLTGDDRYSKQGWDFVDAKNRRVHYTLDKAIQQMHRQSMANESGGICCEPNLVFAVCNNHSSNSYVLHDLLHGTNYAEVNSKWFDWIPARANCYM